MDAAVLEKPKLISKRRAACNGDMAKLMQVASGGTTEPIVMSASMYRTFARVGMVTRHDDALIYLTRVGLLFIDLWAKDRVKLP